MTLKDRLARPVNATPGLSEDAAKATVRAGADFAIVRATGGVLRQKYWTPDGRLMLAVANIRQFVRRDKDGKVIETGIRDANLDKGWLLRPPVEAEKKLFCHWCDEWHDTEEAVEQCRLAQEQNKKLHEVMGKNELTKEMDEKDKKIDELTAKLEALTKLVQEKLGG